MRTSLHNRRCTVVWTRITCTRDVLIGRCGLRTGMTIGANGQIRLSAAFTAGGSEYQAAIYLMKITLSTKPGSSRNTPSPCISGKCVVTLSENHLVKTSQINFISIAIKIIRTSLLEEDRDIRPDTFIPAY